MDNERADMRKRLMEIAAVFLKLGTLAFGGPAAHIAMMDDEIVKKRKWLTREHFVDLIGATNLIPGPNSTELAIHLGFERGGIPGLFIAGTCFILPAMLIVLAVAAAYGKYGVLPQVDALLTGVKPVIIAIVALALIRLWKTAAKTGLAVAVVIAVAAASLLGAPEIPMLLAASVLYTLWYNRARIGKAAFSLNPLVMSALPVTAAVAEAQSGIGYGSLFLIFLKIGSVLYGSGYVLLAFLESEFVQKLGVLTQKQLLDSVAVGQFTPGPVFTTATFIGYLINGTAGAVASTLGIFLPAFILVLLLNPVIPRLRSSPWVSGMLDGVNAASLGLMGAVTIKLAQASLDGVFTIAAFIVSFGVLYRFKVNSAALILAGAAAGWILHALGAV